MLTPSTEKQSRVIKTIKTTISLKKLDSHIKLIRKFKTFLENQIDLNLEMKKYLFSKIENVQNDLPFENYFGFFGANSNSNESSARKEKKLENHAYVIRELYSLIPEKSLLYKLQGKSIEIYKDTKRLIEKMNVTVKEAKTKETVLKMACIYLEILELFKLLHKNPDAIPSSADPIVFKVLQKPIEKIYLEIE